MLMVLVGMIAVALARAGVGVASVLACVGAALPLAASVTAAVAGLTLALDRHEAAQLRRLEVLVAGLRDGAQRGVALAAVYELLARYRPPHPDESHRGPYARFALTAAAGMSAADLPREAAALLESLPVPWLDPHEARARAVLLASARLARLDARGARAALAEAAPGDDPRLDAARALLDARLLVCEGRAAAALWRVEALAGRRAPVALEVVRAHALAGLGLRDAAESALRRLHAWGAPLAEIQRPPGPATPLAEALWTATGLYR